MSVSPAAAELQNVQILGHFPRQEFVPSTAGARSWKTFTATALAPLPAAASTITFNWFEDWGSANRKGQLREAFQTLARQPRFVSTTDARRDLAHLIDWTSETERTAVITSHGRPIAVVLSYRVFQRLLRALARELLAWRAQRSDFSRRVAGDVLEAETRQINRRLRQRPDG